MTRDIFRRLPLNAVLSTLSPIPAVRHDSPLASPRQAICRGRVGRRACVLSLVFVCAVAGGSSPGLAEDIRWTGHYSPVAYPVHSGSFHDGSNWEGLVPAGPGDRALFGTGYALGANPPTLPRYLYLGDKVTDVFPHGEYFTPGGTATLGGMEIQSGDWTFDFDVNYGHMSPPAESAYGNLILTNWLMVGAPMQDGGGGVPHSSLLTLRGPGTASMPGFTIGSGTGWNGRVEVRDGATLESLGGPGLESIIAEFAEGTLVVAGPNTRFVSGGQLTLGKYPSGVGRLEILSGATAESSHTSLGVSGRGTVLISGQGSRWDVGPELLIGSGGSGTGLVAVAANGSVSVNGNTGLGVHSQYASGELTVTNGSQFATAGDLRVGQDGKGALTVTNQGLVTAGNSSIGTWVNAEGAVEIANNGSRLQAQRMYVGENGDGILRVQQAAAMDVEGDLVVGVQSTGTGQLDVRSNARVFAGGDIGIGWWGNGKVDVSGTIGGGLTPSFTATLETNESIRVGILDNSVGELTVRDRGVAVANRRLDIGVVPASQGAVRVSGLGATLTVGEEISIGTWGNGSLTVEDGGSVTTNTWATFGGAEGSVGWGLVDGPGSRLTTLGEITIAHGGNGDLTVRNRAHVRTDTLLAIANMPTAEGELVVESGATVSAQNLQVGGFALAAGRISIRGTDSLLNIADKGVIGQFGNGSLTIENNGSLTIHSLELALRETATADVLVRGAGSILASDSDIHLGSQGTAHLTVAQGGRVSAATRLTLGAFSELDLASHGMVTVGDAVPIAGALVMSSGGILSGAGTIIGDVINDGGLVSPGFSPGALHITGNYLQGPAGVLELEIGGEMAGLYDQLIVSGNLSLAGTINMTLIDGFVPAAGDRFDLFHVTGDFDLNAAHFLWTNAPQGFDYRGDFNDGVYSLSITAVPEPSTYVLAILGAGAVVCTILRRGRPVPEKPLG